MRPQGVQARQLYRYQKYSYLRNIDGYNPKMLKPTDRHQPG